MKEESLNRIRLKMMEVITKEDIDEVDKLELLLNLYHFLDNNKYEKNIKVLKKENDYERFTNIKYESWWDNTLWE